MKPKPERKPCRRAPSKVAVFGRLDTKKGAPFRRALFLWCGEASAYERLARL